MGFRNGGVRTAMFFLTCLAIATAGAGNVSTFARRDFIQHNSSQPSQPAQPEFITAEELKAKLAKNEPVTIIDVRATSSLLDSGDKVKGAVFVKLRRLKYRLGFPPLKDAPRNREVVTYCACPNDESSLRAAQILRESGFTRVRVLKGGWLVWKKAKGQVEPFARVM